MELVGARMEIGGLAGLAGVPEYAVSETRFWNAGPHVKFT
jgi:hypothetical protein